MKLTPRKGIAAGAAALLAAGLGIWTVTSQQTSTATSAVLGQHLTTPTYADVEKSIDELWSSQSALAGFSVDSVVYTQTSRDKVLGICRDGTAAADEDSLQSSRVTACAPLIYYLYRFGTDTHSSQALAAADELYSYVLTRISGPSSSQQMINTILRNWNVAVDTTATPTVQPESTAAQRIDQIRAAINAATAATVTVSSSASTTSATLALAENRSLTSYRHEDGSTVQVLLTKGAAYVKGSRAELASTLKLSIKRETTRWITVPSTDSAYTQFTSGATLADMPSTILPGTTSVDLDPTASALVWKQYSGNLDRANTETLAFDASTSLPTSLTVATPAGAITSTRFAWGSAVVPKPPTNPVPIAKLRSTAS